MDEHNYLVKKKETVVEKNQNKTRLQRTGKFKNIKKRKKTSYKECVGRIIEKISTEEHPNKFCQSINSQKKNDRGILMLKAEGNLDTDNRTKEEASNKQYQSVFTQTDLPTFKTRVLVLNH